ncbi:MAG: thioredoxin fold domain-containing protein [Pseudomonadota bacterium]
MSSFKFLSVAALLLPTLAACAPPYDPSAAEAAPAATTEAAAATPAVAVEPASTPELEALRTKLAAKLAVPIQAIRPSPMPGIYEIQAGLSFGYVSGDGEYLIEGDMVHLSAGENITEKRRKVVRLAAVEKLGVENMIIFAPPADQIKHTLTVFTDIDCGYCRMLHSQMAEYNAKGIAIRYVFFPRSGPNTKAFFEAENVWCSADKKAALTKSKLGEAIPEVAKCKNPILDQYTTGGAIGVRGTPSLILEDGEMIPGYQAPDQLSQILDGKAAKLAGPTDAAPAPKS